MRNFLRFLSTCLVIVSILFLLSVCARKSCAPKNIIIFISDGCGFNHVDAASMYQCGKTGSQVYEKFPIRYAMTTWSATGNKYDPALAWRSFDCVLKNPTDSAASATALATGVKTYNGAVSVNSAKVKLTTIFDQAEKKGRATGVVTSVQFSHATPACFVAHNENRSNYKEIAQEMLLASPVDVIMGCGHPYFDKTGKLTLNSSFKYIGGQEIWRMLGEGAIGCDADNDGDADLWTLIQSRAEFQKLMKGETPSRVLGVPQVYHTLQQERTGEENAAPFEVPFIENVPNLKEMALGAINVLDENSEGFVLMIEGGAVDWAAHDNQSGRMIEEQIDFNNTVEAVVDWVNKQSSWKETLVIVTADHEAGYLCGPDSGNKKPSASLDIRQVWKPLINNGKGNVPGMVWYSDEHTNLLVPFYAKGLGSKRFNKYADKFDQVRGKYLDNTAVAKVILSFLK